MSAISTSLFFGSSPSGRNTNNSGSRSERSDSSRTSSPPNSGSRRLNVTPPGSLRQRENIVVSTRELKQVFDGLKELSDAVRRQNNTLQKMAADIDDSKEGITELRVQLKEIQEKQENPLQLQEGGQGGSSHYWGPLPKELRVRI